MLDYKIIEEKAFCNRPAYNNSRHTSTKKKIQIRTGL
jgi:hypothetical protein